MRITFNNMRYSLTGYTMGQIKNALFFFNKCFLNTIKCI